MKIISISLFTLLALSLGIPISSQFAQASPSTDSQQEQNLRVSRQAVQPMLEQKDKQVTTTVKTEKKRAEKTKDALTLKVDLNQADAKTLSRTIKGIGAKKADAIVKYRTTHGRFNTFEELARVKGLGPQFVKRHLAELEKNFTLH